MLDRALESGVTIADVRWHVAQCWEEREWDAFKRATEAAKARRAAQKAARNAP